MTDYETLYYEQRARFTESNGMLCQERNRAIARAEKAERELAEAWITINRLQQAAADNPAAVRYMRERDRLAEYAGQLAAGLRLVVEACDCGDGANEIRRLAVFALARNPPCPTGDEATK